jgi:DNA invertase Pin-like site-specific DNA recombinase
MNSKVTPVHLQRGAVVYVRQSTLGQVMEHTESQRRQYALADAARNLGFAKVTVIDDDLGRSGSGLVTRPGFEKLVAQVCADAIGAVFCIEASRLARNGRDWHHLIDLCALTGALVIDHDGTYDPRVLNDRLLLGLKGTMSEYELSLLRQRGLAARDAKAARGELRFALPPGYCWDELGRIEKDPDERIVTAIDLVFRKFRELGSARQVLLWARDAGIKLPVYRQGRGTARRIEWRPAAYHTLLGLLKHPIYAGAYVFGRTQQRTHLDGDRARKTQGHQKEQQHWNVLIQDNHVGYISWDEFNEHQRMLAENAHMQKRASRKSGRGGRALLTGMVRCGRCGRMMRVFYGSRSGNAHRYLCRGGTDQDGGKQCIGAGGVRVDRAVAAQIIEAVSPYAIEAALRASDQVAKADDEIRQTQLKELDEAHYEASLAARRHAAVDPEKRLVARELEARWNTALEEVARIEQDLAELDRKQQAQPDIDRDGLMALAQDLPAAWEAPGVRPQAKQRLAHVLIREVVIDISEATNEVIIVIHWHGGRHTEVRVARIRTGRYPEDRHPSPVEVVRTLGGQWSDRQLAVTMNRMRCRSADGQTWTAVRVRELRERLGIAAFDPTKAREETISVDETAKRLGICVGSVHRLIRAGTLPAKQLMPSAPWQVSVASLDSEAVTISVREIINRRPSNFAVLQGKKNLNLPGIE